MSDWQNYEVKNERQHKHQYQTVEKTNTSKTRKPIGLNVSASHTHTRCVYMSAREILTRTLHNMLCLLRAVSLNKMYAPKRNESMTISNSFFFFFIFNITFCCLDVGAAFFLQFHIYLKRIFSHPVHWADQCRESFKFSFH